MAWLFGARNIKSGVKLTLLDVAVGPDREDSGHDADAIRNTSSNPEPTALRSNYARGKNGCN